VIIVNYRGKKVLVTGAAGFIGSHLVEALLENNADVTAFIHYNSRNHWGNVEHLRKYENFSVISGNIEDFLFVKNAITDKDIIFHLAALIGIPYSYSAPESYIRTNIIGTYNILQAAQESDIERVIHTSTSEVYGTAEYTPIDEKHPIKGQSPYSATKIGADKLAEAFYCSFNLPVAIIRPFNAYGPRQSARAIIPSIISQAIINRTIKLGSLSPIRDFTFVKDTVAGFLKMGNSNAAIGKIINIGNGKGITIRNLAEMIIEIIDPDIQLQSDDSRVRPEQSEVKALICNNSLAKRTLNWEPQTSLSSGINSTINWMEQNIEHYKADSYIV